MNSVYIRHWTNIKIEYKTMWTYTKSKDRSFFNLSSSDLNCLTSPRRKNFISFKIRSFLASWTSFDTGTVVVEDEDHESSFSNVSKCTWDALRTTECEIVEIVDEVRLFWLKAKYNESIIRKILNFSILLFFAVFRNYTFNGSIG